MTDKRTRLVGLFVAIHRILDKRAARAAPGTPKAGAWRRDRIFAAEDRRRPSLRYMI